MHARTHNQFWEIYICIVRGVSEGTPEALTKLSAMRLRRGWPRSKSPPLLKQITSSSGERVSKLTLLLLLLIFIVIFFALCTHCTQPKRKIGVTWDEEHQGRRTRVCLYDLHVEVPKHGGNPSVTELTTCLFSINQNQTMTIEFSSL